MKKIIQIFLLILFCNLVHSQNFYEINFVAKNINYKSFVIYYSQNNITVRTSYRSNGSYQVAEYKCEGKHIFDNNGNKHYIFDGKDAKIVYSSKNNTIGYSADNFIFTNINSENYYKDLYIVDDSEISDITGYIKNNFFGNAYKATFKKLNPKTDFTQKYIYSFFNKDEPLYNKLLALNNNTEPIASQSESGSYTVIHLIIAADTEDDNIGFSTEQDVYAIQNMFLKIAKTLKVNCSINKIYGANLKRSEILSKINSLNIKNNDVVVFYYSGHGYNNTSISSKFPTMNLNDYGLGLEELSNIIKSKNARLTLTIGDLCNSIPRSREKAGFEESLLMKSNFNFDKTKLERLFLRAKGSILSTSSKKGQYSYCSSKPNGQQGQGQFTKSFISSLLKEASTFSNNSTNWNIVFSEAYSTAYKNTISQTNQNGERGQYGFNIMNINY